MVLKHFKLLLVGAILSCMIQGCTPDSGQPRPTKGASGDGTNLIVRNIVSAVLPASDTNAQAAQARRSLKMYLKTNSTARNYFESFMPEIERNEKVDQAIKAAIATSGDPRVQAFRQFLSHWHLQWPVVKEGAVGEGGIGFAWYKDLQKFQGGVDARAIIEDRYTLQIILDCNVSPDYNTVEFKNLRFSFGEVKEVRPQPGGGCDIRYNSANGKQFGLKEWNQLKAANWDFSSIGINIISNAPIPNIHQVFD